MTKENEAGVESDRDQAPKALTRTDSSTTAADVSSDSVDGSGVPSTPPDSDDVLDYSTDELPKTKVAGDPDFPGTPYDSIFRSVPYDSRPHEDAARRNIAYILIGLLCFVISAMFALIAFKSIAVADIKDFAVVLGPVVTLVSAATGFYYGTKSIEPPK